MQNGKKKLRIKGGYCISKSLNKGEKITLFISKINLAGVLRKVKLENLNRCSLSKHFKKMAMEFTIY